MKRLFIVIPFLCATLVLSLLVVVSCGKSKEKKKQDILFETYDVITSLATEHYADWNGFSRVGHMTGQAAFVFYKSSIKVRYAVSFPTIASVERASEEGELSNLTIENACGLSNASQYYPISLQGRWQPQGSGGGKLVITVSKNKEFVACIFGDGDWQHEITLALRSADEILAKLIAAKKKLNELDGKDEPVIAEKYISTPSEKKATDDAKGTVIASVNQNQKETRNANIRSDIERPTRESMETVAFPLTRTFISSAANFTVNGASETYFAYAPSEHWGVLIMRYENGAWARRYVYCTYWDKDSKTLSFSTYDQKNGSYIGLLEGKFDEVDGRQHYTAVFTNYKGAKSATFYMAED